VADNDFTLVTTEYPADYVRGGEAYYPVNDVESREIYGQYMSMRPKNVVFTGRLGRFEYNDMDDTIIKAIEVAEDFR
jgi:UDP-galactopyranose mutase